MARPEEVVGLSGGIKRAVDSYRAGIRKASVVLASIEYNATRYNIPQCAHSSRRYATVFSLASGVSGWAGVPGKSGSDGSIADWRTGALPEKFTAGLRSRTRFLSNPY